MLMGWGEQSASRTNSSREERGPWWKGLGVERASSVWELGVVVVVQARGVGVGVQLDPCTVGLW